MIPNIGGTWGTLNYLSPPALGVGGLLARLVISNIIFYTNWRMRLRLIALTGGRGGLPKQSPRLGGLKLAHFYKEIVLPLAKVNLATNSSFNC